MRLPAMVSLTDELTPELRETLKIEQELPVLGFVIPEAGGAERHAAQGAARGGSRRLWRLRARSARRRAAEDERRLSLRWRRRLRRSCGRADAEAGDAGRSRRRGHAEAGHARRSGTTIRSGSRSASARCVCSWRRSSPTSMAASRRPAPRPTSNLSGSPTSPCTSGTRRRRCGTRRTIRSPRRMRTTSRPGG